MRTPILLALAAIGGWAQPRTAIIKVNPDGSFSPQVTAIRSGDTVRWEGLTRTDSIIPVTSSAYPAMCSARRPFDAADRNEFTGPMPFAPSGIFTLSPLDNGLVETSSATCPPGSRVTATGDNGRTLCTGGGAYEASLDSTWRSDRNTGVFIRLLWKDVQPTPTTYSFTVLQREMEAALKYGKVFSLGIKAGDDGTPDWIFSSNADGSARTGGGGGVTRLNLQAPDDESAPGCGNQLDLGNPGRTTYKQLYFAMLTEVARLVKTRSDWYRALTYVKISGANYVSHENRLPKTCKSACPCNPAIFAADGYRPSTLYAFYDEQNQLLRSLFPGKPISYALIQDGFPRVNETGGYENVEGTSSNIAPLPGGTEQTQTIMDRGQAAHGLNFVVQHNGLQTKRMRCNLEGVHPKPILPLDQYWPIGGCPNRWAVKEGAEGQITGFQTTNRAQVNTSEEVESALQNAWDNSDGVFIEIYEEVFWTAQNTRNGVLPSGKTLGDWANDFHRRRIDPVFPNFTRAGDPFPGTYSFTFNRTLPGTAPQTFNFVHGSKCGLGKQEFGQIIVDAQPPAVNTGGVLTALQFGAGTAIAPGSWIEIYGSNLATVAREWTGNDFSGSTAPLQLNGTSVRIGGQPAYVRFVSPGQVNVQAPDVAAGAQTLTVTTPSGTSVPYTVMVNPAQRGLLAPAAFTAAGRQYVAAILPDGAYVLPPGTGGAVSARRARPGDVLTLYGVGFGPVTPAVPAGQVAQQVNSLPASFSISFGPTAAKLNYAGLEPGFVGLYQFNVVVPSITASDAVPITFVLNGTPGLQILFTTVQ